MALGGIPPHVENSDLEKATFSEERYLEIESARITVINPSSRRLTKRYESFFRGLEYFRDELGDKLLVLLLPDEFQVNDALFERLLQDNASIVRARRDWPQERILTFCRQHWISCLDLLPALREAESGGRTYHLRDTHFNARGNRVAGRELVKAILQKLDRGRVGNDRAAIGVKDDE